MLKKFFLGISAIALNCSVFAQAAPKDTTASPKHTRYYGIQSNLLLQQFINLNGNSLSNNNPYLFTFSNSSATTGGGFAFGMGYFVRKSTLSDGITNTNTSDANLNFRFGYEKKFFLHEKWTPFYGIQADLGYFDRDIQVVINQPFGQNTLNIRERRRSIGPSFRGGVLYALSKHILLGTEANFIFQLNFNVPNGIKPNGGFKATDFAMSINAPTAVFLIIRY